MMSFDFDVLNMCLMLKLKDVFKVNTIFLVHFYTG